ncbi:MAG TPA: DUF309 domain-containing protein [Terriglobales bacterium]|nr:DUF309 domain-containing protein [Terriglobales bacterium]
MSKTAYESVKQLGGDIGNLRVSSYAIELDLLIVSKAKLRPAINLLEEKMGRLLTVRELDVPGSQTSIDDEILNGIDLFNTERYWESHEALEFAWRRATGLEKDILQGVILVAAALVHLQKNENKVALSVIQRANDILSQSPKHSIQIDIENLREELAKMTSQNNPKFIKLKKS